MIHSKWYKFCAITGYATAITDWVGGGLLAQLGVDHDRDWSVVGQ